MDKKIMAAIVVVVLVIAIVGTYYVTTSLTGSPQQQTVTLSVFTEYGAGSIKAAFEAVVAKFMEKYPYIYVRHSPMDQTSYNTVMPIWLASGRAPDVFMWLAGAKTQTFVNNGYLENISDIYDSFKDDFSTGVQDRLIKYNGIPYAVPTSQLIYGCFYNKDTFNAYNIQEPANWAEFLAAMETIKQRSNGTIAPYVIAAKFPWLADEAFTCVMSRACSGTFLRQLLAGQANWTDPQAVEALRRFSQLVPYLYEGSTELTDYDASAKMARGEVTMDLIGVWRAGMVTDINASFNLGWFPTPSINAQYNNQLAAHSDDFVISKGTKNIKEAKLFLQFLASEEAQQIYGTVSNQPVCNIHVPTSAYNGTMVKIINSATNADDVVSEIGLMILNDNIRTDYRLAIQKIITGQSTYQEAALELSKLPWGT
jgi:ABC-type glycerol-3-phosphate transport system substrate-binding protein